MALEDIKAEISLLLQQMVNQPEDIHQIEEKLHRQLNMMKAEGLPLPDDLVELQKKLSRNFE